MVGGAPTEEERYSKEGSEVERESDPLPHVTIPLGVVWGHGLCHTVQSTTHWHLEINHDRKLRSWEGGGRGGGFCKSMISCGVCYIGAQLCCHGYCFGTYM
jgi:hypothetical protein